MYLTAGHFGAYYDKYLEHNILVDQCYRRINNYNSETYIILCSTGGDKKMHLDDINLDKNYTPSGAYGRSKLANILFTVELAKRLNGNFF